jgi:tetratricopeptide (TPR) repeat protein
VAFAVIAGVDWLWEIAVIPVTFLFVAAAILQADPRPDAERSSPARFDGRRDGLSLLVRIAAALAAAGAIFVIAVPMLSDERVGASQADFRNGDLAGALDAARDAVDLQPYSASPRLQEAFVLEAMGDLREAAAAARAATEAESTNWETFYVLSRIEAQRGRREPALRALRRARELDPFSAVLNPAG